VDFVHHCGVLSVPKKDRLAREAAESPRGKTHSGKMVQVGATFPARRLDSRARDLDCAGLNALIAVKIAATCAARRPGVSRGSAGTAALVGQGCGGVERQSVRRRERRLLKAEKRDER
jgi:hypothetical protein